ncbi:hypothetical protein NDU88_002735 [Pleurodeles waltl]|uniref:Uncharacterized protein n=1 Tax=Pleurodeles waltl TaxID=8319 RepID=A0AAV7UY41_PLEWA|nr:hypothetical protein NDU88_002735 [Pleurodeles waltl]
MSRSPQTPRAEQSGSLGLAARTHSHRQRLHQGTQPISQQPPDRRQRDAAETRDRPDKRRQPRHKFVMK